MLVAESRLECMEFVTGSLVSDPGAARPGHSHRTFFRIRVISSNPTQDSVASEEPREQAGSRTAMERHAGTRALTMR